MNKEQTNLTVITMIAAIIMCLTDVSCMYLCDTGEQAALLLVAFVIGLLILGAIYFQIFNRLK